MKATTKALAECPAGTYLFRLCDSEPGNFAVQYVAPTGELKKSTLSATLPGVSFRSETGTEYLYSSLVDLAKRYNLFSFPAPVATVC